MNKERKWKLIVFPGATPTNWRNVLNNKDSSLTKFTEQDNVLTASKKSNIKVEKYNEN